MELNEAVQHALRDDWVAIRKAGGVELIRETGRYLERRRERLHVKKLEQQAREATNDLIIRAITAGKLDKLIKMVEERGQCT